MKYLVLGNGFIGRFLLRNLDDSFVPKNRISCKKDIDSFIDLYNPDVIINCVGKTGRPNIDWCEENRDETFFSNVEIPKMIHKSCNEKNKKMVHLSTGCIYWGSDFTEEDRPNFLDSFYGMSKIMAESLLPDDVLKLRIRLPICSYYDNRNLLTKILSFGRVTNVHNSVTILEDFVIILDALVNMGASGIFNCVNEGALSNKELIDNFNKYSETKSKTSYMPLSEYYKQVKVKRSICTLSTLKLNSIGLNMPNVHDSLDRIMKKYARQLCKV